MKVLPVFSNLDAAKVADLLEARLTDFNQSDAKRAMAAMDLFEESIQQWTPAHRWLGWYFNGLSGTDKVEFKKGVSLLVQSARPGLFPQKAMQELLALVAAVGATQALPAMVRLVADGGPWAGLKPSLTVPIMGVLKSLPPSTEEAFGAVSRLAASEGFPDMLAFDAFEVLVSARPEEWANAWLMLEPKFDRALLLGDGPGNALPSQWVEKRIADLAQRCLGALTPYTLGTGLQQLERVKGEALISRLAPSTALGQLWYQLVSTPKRPFAIQLVSAIESRVVREIEVEPTYTETGFGLTNCKGDIDSRWIWPENSLEAFKYVWRVDCTNSIVSEVDNRFAKLASDHALNPENNQVGTAAKSTAVWAAFIRTQGQGFVNRVLAFLGRQDHRQSNSSCGPLIEQSSER
jgi:hypothetical protein